MTAGFRMAAAALLVALAPAARVLALPPSSALTQYVLDVWGPRLGAPRAVRTIGQTPEGYLWLGTAAEGLVRFDGTRFVRDAGFDAVFGRSFRVQSIHVDRHGALWVGTEAGLARRAGGTWRRVSVRDFPSLGEDAEGLLACNRTQGLFRWRAGRVEPEVVQGLEECGGLAVTTSGDVWVAGGTVARDGLVLFRGASARRFGAADGLRGGRVRTLHAGRDGRLWLATRGGLFEIRDDRVVSRRARQDGMPSDEITALLEDADGSLWVGGTHGVARLRQGRAESFGKQQGLPDGEVTAMFEDREGSVWVATLGGLSRFKAGHVVPFGEPEGLAFNRVTSVVQGRDGSIWTWSDGGGLSRLRDGRVQVYTTADGLASNFGGPLFESRDGAIWIGHDKGVSRLKDGRATAYREGPIGRSYVPVLTEDAEGMLTFVFGMGLVRFRDGKVTPYLEKDGVTGEPLQMPFSATWGRDGTLWLATARGVWAVRGGQLRKVWDAPGSASLVAAVHEDAEGVLWFASWMGVVRYRDGAATVIGAAQGLPDTVATILEDRSGSFWLGTARGLLRVPRRELVDLADGRRATAAFEAFGTADGMRLAEVNQAAGPAGWAARDGALWFATRAGAVRVEADRLRRNLLPPPVVVEDVVADGRSLGLGAGTALEIAPGTRRVEIPFTALSLLAPEKVRFRYQLEGFDRGWVEGTARSASYTNLPPGAYRFRVTAANNDGVWNETGGAVELRQRPRAYQTGWFAALAASAAAAVVLLAHRHRVRAHVRRERRLQERIQEALARIRTLTGMLPICAWCKKVREDGGYWRQIESYVAEHSHAEFTHGICPDCLHHQRGQAEVPPAA
jgi:ligand-binding sensor domain-containing protein